MFTNVIYTCIYSRLITFEAEFMKNMGFVKIKLLYIIAGIVIEILLFKFACSG